VKGKTNYVLMGLFVLVLSFAFIAVILWLSAGGGGRSYTEYLVYMRESVAGLSRDSTVTYHGVDVGRVRDIGLDPVRAGEVRLLLQIDEGTPVREDTVAMLETQGLTGLAFVNLTGGHADSPLLVARSGQSYPVIESRRSSWGRLDRAVEEMLSNLNDVSGLLKMLLNDENRQSFARTLAQLDALTAGLSGRSDELTGALDDLAAVARHAREASAGLPGLIAQLERAASALEGMADEIRATGATVDRVVRARDRDLQRFTGEALPEAAAMINEMRRAAENLRRFSGQLARDPAVLLRGRPPRPPGPGE
jgi:phospholipid/cholesterol/gamma-HCH transport system substrate-binding protein